MNKSCCVPVRYIVLFLCFMMASLLYLTRVNLSVTIVSMVNETKSDKNETSSVDGCPAENGNNKSSSDTKNTDNHEKFKWDQGDQGVILGAFFYGYIMLQVVGGRLAEMWGAKWLCANGMLISAIINMLTPVIASWSYTALIISRVMLGLAQAVNFPAGYALLRKWFPDNEVGTALAIFSSGSSIGAIITLSISGVLSSSDFLNGWPSVFYVSGAAALVWFLLWVVLSNSEPDNHFLITNKELQHIQSNKPKGEKSTKKVPKAPWVKILLSKPVWCTAVIKFTGAWNFLLVLSKVPVYLESVLHYSINVNGFMMSLIYLCLAITLSAGGMVADFIINRKYASKNVVRKLFETIALGGSSVFLALIPLMQCNKIAVIAMFMLSMFCYGQCSGGDIPLVADMTKNFTGTIMAITNTVGASSGFLAPLFVGLIIKSDPGSRILWSYVFYFSAAINAVAIILFLIWGDAQIQQWDHLQEMDDEKEEEKIVSKI